LVSVNCVFLGTWKSYGASSIVELENGQQSYCKYVGSVDTDRWKRGPTTLEDGWDRKKPHGERNLDAKFSSDIPFCVTLLQTGNNSRRHNCLLTLLLFLTKAMAYIFRHIFMSPWQI